MLLELIPEKPLVIEGEPPSRANIALDYKLKNVPHSKIKNPLLAAKKRRWDLSNSYNDLVALSIKQLAVSRGFKPATPNTKVAVAARLYFGLKKKDGKAQLLKKDADNVMKGVLDAIEGSGVIVNDCQILDKVISKRVSVARPRLEIWSLAFYETDTDLLMWMLEVQRRMFVADTE